MKIRKIQYCSNCGRERPRNYHCSGCNAIGREKRIKFVFRIGWRRPKSGEFRGIPLHEREIVKVPVDPPFDER